MSVSYNTPDRLTLAMMSSYLTECLNKTFVDTQATVSKDMEKQQQIFKGFVVWWGFLCLQFFGGKASEVSFAKNMFPMEGKYFFSHTTFDCCIIKLPSKPVSVELLKKKKTNLVFMCFFFNNN